MRKGMLQLWADLEQVASDLGVTFKVTNARKVTKKDVGNSYEAPDSLVLKSKGPRTLRSNSTYYRSMRHIDMRFQPDFTPAYKAGIFAHELGHHISQAVFGNRFSETGPQRKAEEQRASYHGYELLYQLTKGRVPLGCIDLFNISLTSYDTGDQL